MLFTNYWTIIFYSGVKHERMVAWSLENSVYIATAKTLKDCTEALSGRSFLVFPLSTDAHNVKKNRRLKQWKKFC